jgi:all-trans-retinol 13,14-reductase
MTARAIGTPYKQFRSADRFDAIVIGSGIGGLGAAALLAKVAGQRVLVLERHYTAGGFTHVFHRPGFEWDVGVHYIGQVHKPASQVAAMFEFITEGRLSWNAMPDAYDRVWIDGFRFDYVSGKERLRRALIHAFSREERAIDGYFKAIERCMRGMPLFFAEKVLPPLFGRMVGSGLRAGFLRYARQTTGQLLDDLGTSQTLKAVLTAQWGDYGLPPGSSSFGIHAVIAQHYFDGASYPIGGASRIAASVLPTIERSGGAVVVGAEVDRIIVEGRRAVGVRMQDGREFRARAIVSDAGLRTTLERLLPEDAPAEARDLADRARRVPSSSGHLCLYVGLTASPDALRLDPANLWIHPTLDFDRNWAAFAADSEAAFPFLFISFPSAKDPSFDGRYPGHQTIEIVTAAPFERFAEWAETSWKRRGEEYEAVKERLAQRLLAELYRHVPQTRGAVTTWELSTPLSTRHFDNASAGETYGLTHTPARFELRDLTPRTPIDGLFLTGQDVATEGVSGALAGAVTTASVLLHQNVFSVIAKAAHFKRAAA